MGLIEFNSYATDCDDDGDDDDDNGGSDDKIIIIILMVMMIDLSVGFYLRLLHLPETSEKALSQR